MNTRVCGGCTACCLTHEILEIKKPAGKLCPHCAPGVGCNIYDHRPLGCSLFRCDWLKGSIIESSRPDRSGVVFDSCSRKDTPGQKVLFETLLQIYEAIEGALDTSDVWEVTWATLDIRIHVMHLYLSGRKVLFLPEGADLPQKTRRFITKGGFEITPYPIIRP